MEGKSNKVLVLCTSQRISGAEKSLIDVLSNLCDDFDLFILIDENSELIKFLNPYKTFFYNLVQIRKKESLVITLKKLVRVLKTAYKISLFVKEHDINFIYSNKSSDQLYAVVVKILTGKPLIWHVRDNLNNKLIRFFFCWFSNKIVCVSKHIFNQIIFKEKAKLIYNGIDIETWKANPVYSFKLKEKLGIDPETVVVAHVGQLVGWKRHDVFLSVAKLIINNNIDKTLKVHFIIIGSDLNDGNSNYATELQQTISISKLTTDITILSYQSDYIEYLNGVDIILHLADREPFGRVVIEAMALEIPVIAGMNGGPAEVIVNEVSGYLLPNSDVYAIANKTKLLIENSLLRKKLGAEGREIVKRKFSIENLKKINSVIFSADEKNTN